MALYFRELLLIYFMLQILIVALNIGCKKRQRYTQHVIHFLSDIP